MSEVPPYYRIRVDYVVDNMIASVEDIQPRSSLVRCQDPGEIIGAAAKLAYLKLQRELGLE